MLVSAGGSVVSRDGEDLDLPVVEMVVVEVVCWGSGHAYAGGGSGGVREPLGQRLSLGAATLLQLLRRFFHFQPKPFRIWK